MSKIMFVGVLCLCVSLGGFAQDKPAYKIFSAKGKAVPYSKMMKQLLQTDFLYFGELHNNPIAHWLEYEITRELIEKKGGKNIVLGAEMFETDQQQILNRYFHDEISVEEFEEEMRWPNYETDYKPILELCKAAKVKLIATNVPRKYARIVARKGLSALDSLPDEEKELMAELPFSIDYTLPSYKAMMDMAHGGTMKPKNFVGAQAIKDATMAQFLGQFWRKGILAYHINGSYHSDSKEGIIWYIQRSHPSAKVLNISLVEQEEVERLEGEHFGKADFIIVVPASMTKTY